VLIWHLTGRLNVSRGEKWSTHRLVRRVSKNVKSSWVFKLADTLAPGTLFGSIELLLVPHAAAMKDTSYFWQNNANPNPE